MKEVIIGMVGAGRASELHINAIKRISNVPYRLKTVVDQRKEQLLIAQKRYGFERASCSFDDLLSDPEIEVIDICTPPCAHAEMIEKALLAGKNVICEKPLTGYFGRTGDLEPIGDRVSKQVMYDKVLEEICHLRSVINQSDKRLMYAENFVYAPAVRKAAEIVRAKKSRILCMKGEESLKGSSSPVAGEWSMTGGGTFIRTGVHPLTAILWLKRQEALARGVQIGVRSVTGVMDRITSNLDDYEHRHIAARPHDVEDFGAVILDFSDDTKAVVMATDTLLGGSRNYIEVYCNDAAINCNLTMSNMMSTYFLDEDNLDDVYISEMLPSKIGWNNPFLEDEIIRGYTAEMQDFMECVYYNREPLSGFDLACDTIQIIYAAYLSAELGRKVVL